MLRCGRFHNAYNYIQMDGSGAVAISNDEASKGTKRKTLSNYFKDSAVLVKSENCHEYYFQIRIFYLHRCHWHCHCIYMHGKNISVLIPFDLSMDGNGRKA